MISLIILLNSFKLMKTFQQQAKLPSPMIFPKVVQGKAVYYIISQGYSDNFKTKFNLQFNTKPDTQVIIYVYNPSNPILKKLADAPMVRNFFGVCADGDKIYIAGGYNAQWKPTNTVYEYNMSNKNWSVKKPMNTARADFALERIGKKIYALSGGNSKTIAEQYSIETDSWSVIKVNMKPKLEMLSEVSASTVVENKIFLFGKTSDEFQVFNSENNSLDAGLPVPFKSEYFSIAPFSKRIYVSGGNADGIISGSIYLYDYVENSLSKVGKIPFPRFGSGLIFNNGMLLYLGGALDNSKREPTTEIFIYKPIR